MGEKGGYRYMSGETQQEIGVLIAFMQLRHKGSKDICRSGYVRRK